MSAISAASNDACLPRAPIAMPTSARARAGASFTPSPTIATVWPSRRNVSTAVICLPVIIVRASVIPSSSPTRRAASRLSPVTMINRWTPVGLQPPHRVAAPARVWSANSSVPTAGTVHRHSATACCSRSPYCRPTPPSFNDRGHTETMQGPELVCLRDHNPAMPGRSNNSFRQRMRGAPVRRCRVARMSSSESPRSCTKMPRICCSPNMSVPVLSKTIAPTWPTARDADRLSRESRVAPRFMDTKTAVPETGACRPLARVPGAREFQPQDGASTRKLDAGSGEQPERAKHLPAWLSAKRTALFGSQSEGRRVTGRTGSSPRQAEGATSRRPELLWPAS